MKLKLEVFLLTSSPSNPEERALIDSSSSLSIAFGFNFGGSDNPIKNLPVP